MNPKSDYNGVAWCVPAAKWRAYANIRENGKWRQIHLGLFTTEETAASTAQIARSFFECIQHRRPRPIALQGLALLPLVTKDNIIRSWTLVDAKSLYDVGDIPWRLHTAGYVQGDVLFNGLRTTVYLHRVIAGLSLGSETEVDHKNRNRLDNRRANLRVVTHTENAQNLDPSSNSTNCQYRGASRFRNRWRARIHVDGHERHLGLFDNELEAAITAAKARKQHMPFTIEPLLESLGGDDLDQIPTVGKGVK